MEFLPAPLDRAASDAMADRCQSLRRARLGLLNIQVSRQAAGFVGTACFGCLANNGEPPVAYEKKNIFNAGVVD